MRYLGASAVVVGIVGALFLFSDIGVISARNERRAEPKAEILFAGDMMFDRSVRVWGKEKGDDYLFSCIDDVLQGADIVVANILILKKRIK